MRIPKRLLMFAVGGSLIAAVLFHYKERDSYRCQVCFAQKDVYQWRFGSWMGASVPLTPSWERIKSSSFQQDFLPADHVHDWKFAQGSPYHLFGTLWSGCALGNGRHVSEFFRMYESSPEFRTFIAQKLQDGSLTRTNVIGLMSAGRTAEASPQKRDADALLNDFFAK